VQNFLVFEEILESAQVQLGGLLQRIDFLDPNAKKASVDLASFVEKLVA